MCVCVCVGKKNSAHTYLEVEEEGVGLPFQEGGEGAEEGVGLPFQEGGEGAGEGVGLVHPKEAMAERPR